MNSIPVRDKLPERITILIQRLQTAYDGTVPGPTVEAVVRSCYAPLTHATITHTYRTSSNTRAATGCNSS